MAVCAAAITACASSNASQCEATGVLCPSGTHCAAAEPICISDTNLCGNAHIDDGEVCDDGNTKDGDGCSHDCKSTEVCGNGIKDVNAHIPEVCDDSNTKDGDGCSHDCLSLEVCGNKIVDIGEVCDDGNDVAGDGCSHNCQSNETCGNSIVDPGEACDKPGDLATCSVDCKSTLQCDNGTVDPGEECDVRLTDSNNNVILTNSNDSDCRADCTLNRCGDGFVDTKGGGPGHLEHVEQCDGAPPAAAHSRAVVPTETSACNIDCTTPSCGDGKINRHFTPSGAPGPEQCDNVTISGVTITSLNTNDRDCTAACQVNRCGDGKVNLVGPAHKEDCDDGDSDDHNGCTNECKVATCGDGILKTTTDTLGPAEECDDHNTDDNDGCSSTCKVEFCGDHVKNNGNANEDCDTGAVSTATCNFNCKTPRCGDGIVNAAFKPDGSNPEQCDPPSAAMGCSATCRFEHCGNGVKDPGEECDGTDGVTGGQICSASCRIQQCGNGILDPGEQCDDNNKLDNDDCLSSGTSPATACKLATCGDGKRNARTEDCDDGGLNGTPASPNNCSATCKTIGCGNGVREQGEECDDGNRSDTDDCVSSNPDPATCKNATCGDGKINARTETCDDGALNGTVASPNHCSATCQAVSCGNGVIEQGEECDDGSTGAINNNGAGKRCNAACQFNVCGDNDKLLGVEQCDDGNPTEGDGCDTNCTFSACGNGIKAGTEACDDGNVVNGDGCDTNCTVSACGNGIKAGTETCDDGNTITETCPYGTSCTVCDATCHQVAGAVPACNDGNLDGGHEICDDGNAACGTCNASCSAVKTALAATGVIFAAAGGNIVEGDHFVINDGAGTTINFKFTNVPTPPPPPAGTINLAFAMMDTNAQTATTIVNAINSSGLLIDATLINLTSGVVTLKSRLQSSSGNQAIDDQVATPNFGAFGMSGGQAGDCATGNAAANRCEQDADCLSGRCNAGGHCQACVLNTDCASRLCAITIGRCEFCVSDSDCGVARTCNTGTGVCSP
ncbi:MAG TPA: DUF4215 domain-containing protein [Kofleriaceae bacterium]